MRIKVKISGFIPEIREITRDTNAASYIRDDAAICRAVVDAFRHLHSVRPSSRYDENCALEDVVFPADSSALADFEVGLNEEWRLGIVYYAAARCYEADITDSVNLQLAQSLFQRAEAEFLR